MRTMLRRLSKVKIFSRDNTPAITEGPKEVNDVTSPTSENTSPTWSDSEDDGTLSKQRPLAKIDGVITNNVM